MTESWVTTQSKQRYIINSGRKFSRQAISRRDENNVRPQYRIRSGITSRASIIIDEDNPRSLCNYRFQES
jgi:hypothetical protein